MSHPSPYDLIAADEKLSRLRSAYLDGHWAARNGAFHTMPSENDLDRAFWDYLDFIQSIFNCGQFQEAELRCLKIGDDHLASGYCRGAAYQLAARCSAHASSHSDGHELALVYLRMALRLCEEEVESALDYRQAGSVSAGNECIRQIKSEIEECEMQQLADEYARASINDR